MALIADLNKLLEHKAHQTNEDRAFIHSLEGGIYLLEIEYDGFSEFVKDPKDNSVQAFKSLHQAKRQAKKMGVGNIQLSLNTPYDQMIGLASCTETVSSNAL